MGSAINRKQPAGRHNRLWGDNVVEREAVFGGCSSRAGGQTRYIHATRRVLKLRQNLTSGLFVHIRIRRQCSHTGNSYSFFCYGDVTSTLPPP